MHNGSKLGCFGFLALCLAVYFLWLAVLYVGIPLAILGGAVSARMFSRYRDDDTRHGEDMRFVAASLAGGAVVLGLISAAGNIFSDDGPFGRSQQRAFAASTASKEGRGGSQIIPQAFRGRWAASGDCGNVHSSVRIDNDSISFEGRGEGGSGLSFSAYEMTARDARSITLRGTNIIVAETWADSGYQADAVRLSVSENGSTLWMDGSAFRRCPD